MKTKNEKTEKEMEWRTTIWSRLFDVIFSLATKVQTIIADDAADNINVSQRKQKRDCDRRQMSKAGIKMNDIVLFKNNKRFYRMGGKFSQKCLSPYTVMNTSRKGVAALKNNS